MAEMVDWAAFEAGAPRMATEGRRLLYRSGEGSALLATVRDHAPPRIHPIKVGVIGDGLYAFVLDSAKQRDLERDGRFALHAHQDPLIPHEFMVRGRAQPLEADAIRARVAAEWFFTVDNAYQLFVFSIESALLGTRPTVKSWPPTYETWRPSP